MTFYLYQIDAWRYDEGWNYNNSIKIGNVEIHGEPSPRKLFKALRDQCLLDPHERYELDTSLSYDGIYTVCRRSNHEPLYDLMSV